MVVVDASVWVSAVSVSEVESVRSQAFFDWLELEKTEMVEPELLRAEVAAAIARSGRGADEALGFAGRLAEHPSIKWVGLDRGLGTTAMSMAARHRLRGSDAVYAAVAVESGAVLVSLDKEHLSRLGGVVRVVTPAEYLSGLAEASAS